MICGWSEKDFQYLAKKDLHWVEFCINYYNDANAFMAQVPQIKEYCKKYNVNVGSMGRWGEHIQTEDGKLMEDKLQNHLTLIDAASQLGCPVYNMGVNWADGVSEDQNYQFAIDILNKIVAYGKERNVKIALYNCSWNCFTYSPKSWSRIIPAVEGLGIKYDTSHAIGRGSDFMKEMRDWGQYFYHIHLKGSLRIAGEGYDDPPMGLDQTNWGAFFTMLYTKNYRGMVSLEPHSGYWKGGLGEWGVDFSLNYAKQFLMPEEYENITDDVYMP